MAAFLAQKSKLLAAINDEGGLFECRFLGRLLAREQVAVATAHTEALSLGGHLSALREQIEADLAPTDDTPGVLDTSELQRFRKRLAALGHDASAHTAHLEALT
jgi:hypothetical protein